MEYQDMQLKKKHMKKKKAAYNNDEDDNTLLFLEWGKTTDSLNDGIHCNGPQQTRVVLKL